MPYILLQFLPYRTNKLYFLAPRSTYVSWLRYVDYNSSFFNMRIRSQIPRALVKMDLSLNLYNPFKAHTRRFLASQPASQPASCRLNLLWQIGWASKEKSWFLGLTYVPAGEMLATKLDVTKMVLEFPALSAFSAVIFWHPSFLCLLAPFLQQQLLSTFSFPFPLFPGCSTLAVTCIQLGFRLGTWNS